MYKHFFKRIFDFLLSLSAILILSPIWLIIIIAIIIDDPGPIFFTQKRVGKKKRGEITYFKILKFRTMKTCTPHDTPTHLLENPDQYITRLGKFLRKTSLDELPQLLCILAGKMSIIGPRPALWNQDDLVAEREKYGVNDLVPGLTGWAQINGRDTLTIADKAKLDGEYAQKISFFFDCKCFFGTVKSVLVSDGVQEGKAEETEKEALAEEGEPAVEQEEETLQEEATVAQQEENS